jgi:regulatory protein YycI of two-component signal transduction system YycFG
MMDVIIENAVAIVATLLMTLIGVLGTWLTAKLAKREELTNINAAQQEAIKAAQITVGELQQTLVEGLKAGHEDGKLTKEEIEALGKMLVDNALKKMSVSAIGVLNAAAVDITALIKGAGEDWIQKLKQ